MTRKGFFGAVMLLLCATIANAHTPIGAGQAYVGDHRDARLSTRILSDDGLHIDIVLTNDGHRPVTVLTRGTPLDTRRLAPPLAIERLQVSGDTQDEAEYLPVAWQGRLAKRMPPGPDELLALAPGESVSARVALDAGWHIRRAGDYRVGLAAPWRTSTLSPAALVMRSAARRQRLDLGVVSQPMPSPVSVMLLDNASPLEMLQRLRTPRYAQCSAGQQQGILEAAAAAERLVADSVAGLRSLAADELARSPRYLAWFGEYDRRRAANVLADLSAISDTIADDAIGFNCDCAETGVFAYVFPTRPYDVWLCPAFWNASVEGTDSRAGTVVHELSHFRIVAGTSDHVYTQGRAQDLADSDPELAIDNADSFEYFVENTPAIALRAEALPGSVPDDRGGVQTASLSRGQRQRYTIESGRRVSVESFEGDADLFVYPGLTDQGGFACASELPSTVSSIDRCELSGSGPWTAIVIAHTDARYRLTVAGAGASAPERPSDDDPTAGTGRGASGGSVAGGGGVADGGAGAAGPLGALIIALVAVARARRVRPVRRALPALLLAIVAGSGCALQAAEPAGEPSVMMSVSIAPRAGAAVRVTLHNPGTLPARVLAWNTPFESALSADVFAVRAHGERAPYIGRTVKRALPPPPDAWLVLQPGERRHADVALARHYALDGEGPWQVTLDASRLEAPVVANGATISVRRDEAPVVSR